MSVLVAGVGNIFLGDDAFGVEVVKRLAERPLPGWLRVVDFGIRGFDLTYALLDPGYSAVVLVDLVPRGHAPGTLSVIEPHLDPDEPAELALDTHGMDPVSVLRLVRSMGGTPPPLRVIGCEPLRVARDDNDGDDGDDDDMSLGLSEPVAAAIDPAVILVLEVAESLRAETAPRA